MKIINNKITIAFLLLLLFSFQLIDIIEAKSKTTQKIIITSSVFSETTMIPNKYSCNAENISLPLNWSNVPSDTKSFAILMYDPDAPQKNFVHWIIFNIPGSSTGLSENIQIIGSLEDGTKQGTNGTSAIGYFGPCPPPGPPHRYVFKIFALDTLLNLEAGATKTQLLNAMKNHILAKGKLVGKYKTVI